MSKRKKELENEELEEQNGEELPEREVMSVVSVDPYPVDWPTSGGEMPGDNPRQPIPPEETA